MGRKYNKLSSKNVWIFCEGKKTERNYFNKIIVIHRIKHVIVKDSNKTHALGLMEDIVSFKNGQDKDFNRDEFFCVFDRDSNSNKDLKMAIELAKKNSIKIIFSNPCFEYWVLSHFERYEKGIELGNLLLRLNSHLKYKKGDNDLYDKTKNRVDDAVKHSKYMKEKHTKSKIRLISRESNPYSSVGELVKYLLSLS